MPNSAAAFAHAQEQSRALRRDGAHLLQAEGCPDALADAIREAITVTTRLRLRLAVRLGALARTSSGKLIAVEIFALARRHRPTVRHSLATTARAEPGELMGERIEPVLLGVAAGCLRVAPGHRPHTHRSPTPV
jgi:hypothetical protein